MTKRSVKNILSIIFFALTQTSGAIHGFAQQAPIKDPAAHDALIAIYFKSAFASHDQLLKPSLPPAITYHCDLEFCQQVMMEPKSDFPSDTQQVTVSSSLIDANEIVSVRFFSNDLNAAEASSKLIALAGEQSSILNFPNCNLTRYVLRNAVTTVIVDVAEGADIKSNIACALFEVARGTGLDIQQSYPEYSKAVSKLDDHDFARFTIGIRNFLDLHWSPRTQPGMTQAQVKEALQAIIVGKNN